MISNKAGFFGHVVLLSPVYSAWGRSSLTATAALAITAISSFLIGHVEPPLDHFHRDDAVRQRRPHLLGIDLFGLLHADRDVDQHVARVDPRLGSW